MRQTLFYIPYEVWGVPLFGWGLLLGVWVLFHAVRMGIEARRPGSRPADLLAQLPLVLLIAAALILLPRFFPGEGLPIRGYGVMLMLAVVCGVGLSLHRARQMGVDQEIILALAFWLFVSGIIGARAFHVIQKWESEYVRDTWQETLFAVLNIPNGGLVVYGSFIASSVAFVIFVRRHKLPLLALADLVTPSLMVGLALGRIGCLLNGCCFGGPCEHPWAVTFPAGSPPFVRQVERGDLLLYGLGWSTDMESPAVIEKVIPGSPAALAGLHAGDVVQAIEFGAQGYEINRTGGVVYSLVDAYQRHAPIVLVVAGDRHASLPAAEPLRTLPVHPTQLYSTIGATLICLFLLAYYPYRRHDGEVVALLLTIYSIVRILEEAIRTDEAGVLGTSLSISQVVSLGMLAGVSVLWVYLWKQPVGSVLPPRPGSQWTLSPRGSA